MQPDMRKITITAPPTEVVPLRECGNCHLLLAIDIPVCTGCMTELPSYSQIFPTDIDTKRLSNAADVYQSEADKLRNVIADLGKPISSFDEFILRLYLIFQSQARVVEFLKSNGFKLPGKKDPSRQVAKEDLMLMMNQAEKSEEVPAHLKYVVHRIKTNFYQYSNSYLDVK
jgi:hypothetical protein